VESSAPIRIGFVLHVMQVAGAEVLVAETIRRLADTIDPVVFCLDGVGQLGEQMQREGVPVVCFGRRAGFDAALPSRIAREIKRRDLEIMHAHQYTPFFYTSLAKIMAAKRFHLIFTEHGRHFPDVVSMKRRIVNRFFLGRLADEINAVCQFSVSALIEKDGFVNQRIELVENGIEVDQYGPAEDRNALRTHLGLDLDRKYILCVARFHPVKDHQTLIHAFARVAREHVNTDLLLAGDGPLRDKLENQVSQLDLSKRVRFLGVRHDVPDLLRAADIFTLTSLSEAASLTLIEAMATGLPVVVTDVGGNGEIVRSEFNGLMIPRGESEAASRAFSRLLSQPDFALRLGRAARESVLERYRLDRAVSRYRELYLAARLSRNHAG
jgi:L-malate glycosyltransferase